ncbi:TraQ conjugal transfer family protein [Dysgonomonas reticulitermitis]
MKNMLTKIKRAFAQIIWLAAIMLLACACSGNLDIKQDYEFKVTHLPVPKKIKKGETIEIRCQLEQAGYYKDTGYVLRYFQTGGRGLLRMGNNEPLLPNDLYELKEDTFRLYYTSQSEEQAVIDIYFFSSEGNSFILSFSFNNDNPEGEQP